MDAYSLAPASAVHRSAQGPSVECESDSDMQHLVEELLAHCGPDLKHTHPSSSLETGVVQARQGAVRKPSAILKRVQCDVCWTWLARRDILLRHKRVMHGGVDGRSRYRCSHCSKAFARNDNLKRHVDMVHWSVAATPSNPDFSPASPNTLPTPGNFLPDVDLEAAFGIHAQLFNGGSTFGSSPKDSPGIWSAG
ncbi:hypothetical protein DL770_005369 [Monosporascus sp. CRB-9-2]|nr:hypothetical protein DL770_005369 [Monosporascus sp. CRB-9-2]